MSTKFAIIETGGKQYRVEKGMKLNIEKLSKKEGVSVAFDEVLLYTDGKSVEVGTPILKSVKVTARVLEQGKGKKVIVYKYKRRKRYSRKKGHRQPYTKVEIVEIKKGASSIKKSAKKKTTATALGEKAKK